MKKKILVFILAAAMLDDVAAQIDALLAQE